MTGRKGYNSPANSPARESSMQRSSSTQRSHSHSNAASRSASGSPSPRIASASEQSRTSSRSGLGGSGRKGYNASPISETHLSPSEATSPGSPRPGSRGRQTSGAAAHWDRSTSRHSGLSGSGRKGYNEAPSPPSQSRSSSRARFSPDPALDFGPRTHVGMGGRKGYNANKAAALVATEHEPLGLGLDLADHQAQDAPQRHDGLAGRKGYNGACTGSSPPRR